VPQLLEPPKEELHLVPGQQPAEPFWTHWTLNCYWLPLCVCLRFLEMLFLKLLWVAGSMSEELLVICVVQYVYVSTGA